MSRVASRVSSGNKLEKLGGKRVKEGRKTVPLGYPAAIAPHLAFSLTDAHFSRQR